MLAVLAVSTLFYVLVALAAVSVLGWAELSTSVSPMSAVAAKTTGSGVGILVSWLSLAATGSTGLFLIVAASRAVWAMSCAGVLPLPFCTIGRRRTPWIAIVGVGVLAALFVLTRNVETVAQVTNIAVLLAFAGVNASAIKLLGKSGLGIYQGLRSRLLPVLGLVSSLWLAFNTGTTAIISAALLIVIGMVYYRLFLMKKAVFLDVPGQENNKPE
jgi:APA family basic amino acid/polyamine antiporter